LRGGKKREGKRPQIETNLQVRGEREAKPLDLKKRKARHSVE